MFCLTTFMLAVGLTTLDSSRLLALGVVEATSEGGQGGQGGQTFSDIEMILPSRAPSRIVAPHESASSSCATFSEIPNAFSLGGDVLHKISDDFTPAECRQACLETANFVCAAAQIQAPGSCFVHGYRLHSAHFSTHYTRICNHGPTCFTKIDNVSGGFGSDNADGILIPQPYARNPEIYPLYCMAHCELLDQHCLGFDVRISNNVPRCYFARFRVISGSSMNLSMRKC